MEKIKKENSITFEISYEASFEKHLENQMKRNALQHQRLRVQSRKVVQSICPKFLKYLIFKELFGNDFIGKELFGRNLIKENIT